MSRSSVRTVGIPATAPTPATANARSRTTTTANTNAAAGQQMTDLRDRIAAVAEQHVYSDWYVDNSEQCSCGRMGAESWSQHLADAVIAALKQDGWTLVPPGVAVFTETYIGDGRGSYADSFCRGGCDCSCCYGMAAEPCHCRDAVCNCGGDRAAHGQQPLEAK